MPTTKSAFTSMTVGGLVLIVLPSVLKAVGLPWYDDLGPTVTGWIDHGSEVVGVIIAYIGRQRAAKSGQVLTLLPKSLQ